MITLVTRDKITKLPLIYFGSLCAKIGISWDVRSVSVSIYTQIETDPGATSHLDNMYVYLYGNWK